MNKKVLQNENHNQVVVDKAEIADQVKLLLDALNDPSDVLPKPILVNISSAGVSTLSIGEIGKVKSLVWTCY